MVRHGQSHQEAAAGPGSYCRSHRAYDAGGIQPPGAASGYTFVEALVVSMVASLTLVAGAPAFVVARHDIQANAATTYVAALVREARIEAARRRASVGLRIDRDAEERWQIQSFIDGDGDGLRSADIETGTDPARGPAVRLDQVFPGVSFGIVPGAVAVEAGDSLADGNPVRLGRSGILSCSPQGGCTGGSLYLAGPFRRQMVVRVLGGTGRVRSGRYLWNLQRWVLR